MSSSQGPQSIPLFSEILSQSNHPGGDHAITIEKIKGIPFHEHVECIGDYIGPSNIHAADSISRNRICIYFKSVKHVEQIVDNGLVFTVKGQKLNIKRLIPKAKKIVINVSPSVPNTIIENKLEDYGIKKLSDITFSKANLPKSTYCHVVGFKRYMLIDFQDVSKIPDSFKIKYQGMDFTIFISEDKLICYKCKLTGHFAKNCPKNQEQERANSHVDNSPAEGAGHSQAQPIVSAPDLQQEPSETTIDTNVNKLNVNDTSTNSLTRSESILKGSGNEPIAFHNNVNKETSLTGEENTPPVNVLTGMDTSASAKRPRLPEDYYSDSSIQSDGHENKAFVTPRINKGKKKSRNKSTSSEKEKRQQRNCFTSEFIRDHSSKLRAYLQVAPHDHPLTYDQTVEFLVVSQNRDKIIPYAESYALDTTTLASMVRQFYNHIDDRSLKIYLTKLAKCLDDPDGGSELSQDNYQSA